MNVLISGGSGAIGKKLTTLLVSKGYTVAWLSRSEKENIKSFTWNIPTQEVDPAAIAWCDAIICLSGASVAGGRWTNKRKKEILSSRVDGLLLLTDELKRQQKKLSCFISASATGYYNNNDFTHIYKEEDIAGTDFLSKVCIAWEEEAKKIEQTETRVVMLRTGIVLDSKEGMIKQLRLPAKMHLLTTFGKGHNYVPWIHIDDLCAMYLYALEKNNLSGIFNATAPSHTTQKEFMQQLAKQMKSFMWVPGVPASLLRLLMGEMSVILTKGCKVSSNKIRQSGFAFCYTHLKDALDNLIH